jgi:hypothetical protein
MTVDAIKAEMQSDLYKVTAKLNADLRVKVSDLLEKTKLLEGLLAECHEELKGLREAYDYEGLNNFAYSGIQERIENYFAGNGAITYAELEIPEEKPVPQDESNWVDIDINTLKPGIFDGSFGGTYSTQDMIDDAKGAVSGAAFHDLENTISEFEKPKPVNPLSKLEIPIGYELSVGSDEGVGTIVVLMLRNSFTRKLTLLHMGSASLGLADDEISSIQKRIDEVAK